MADYAAANVVWGGSTTTLLALMKLLSGITDTSKDALYSGFLQVAGDAAEAYTDRVLLEQTVTERIARSRSPILLHNPQVASLDAVTLDGVDVLVDYELFYEGNLAYLTKSRYAASANCNFDQLDVEYTAGYGPLPSELGYALVRTAMLYDDQDDAGPVRKESVVGVGSFEYDTSSALATSVGGLPDKVMQVLDKYRRLQA